MQAVKFVSKLFHPNVYGDGKICLDILQNQWSPIYDISGILTSIQSLLSDPNPASPANAGQAVIRSLFLLIMYVLYVCFGVLFCIFSCVRSYYCICI